MMPPTPPCRKLAQRVSGYSTTFGLLTQGVSQGIEALKDIDGSQAGKAPVTPMRKLLLCQFPMAASSVSTYLDVTRAATEPGTSSAPLFDSADLERAAKLLAAIHSGTETVAELAEKTGIEMSHVMSLLGALSKAGMVELETNPSGVVSARLTEPTKAALTSA